MINFKKINLNTILIISLVIFILLYLKQCNFTYKLEESLEIESNNRIALTDSVDSYVLKNGELVFQKAILISDKKNLQTLNSELYNEIKQLKENPKIIVKQDIEIVHDTIPVDSYIEIYPNSNFKIKWEHDTIYNLNNYHNLSAETLFSLDTNTGVVKDAQTYITSNEIGISLTTALVKEKDHYKILVNSDYPNFNILNINGAIVDKKTITSDESSIVIGPSIGYGVVFSSGGYVHHGVNIGFNLTYNLNKKIKGLFRGGKLLK